MDSRVKDVVSKSNYKLQTLKLWEPTQQPMDGVKMVSTVP
jgi:hypothetical protein